MIQPPGDCDTWPKTFPGWLVECNWINLIGFVFLGPSPDYFLSKKMEKLWWKNNFPLEEAGQHNWAELRDLRYQRGSQREGWSWQDLASYQEFYKNSFKSFHWEAKCAKSSEAKHRNINKTIWSSIQFIVIATTRHSPWWTRLGRIGVKTSLVELKYFPWHEIAKMLF